MKNNVCLLLCTTGLFLHQVRSVPWNKLQWANYWFSSGHSDVNCLFKEMMNLVCTDECELQYVHKYGSNMECIKRYFILYCNCKNCNKYSFTVIFPHWCPRNQTINNSCTFLILNLLLFFVAVVCFLMYLNTSEDFILQSVFTLCATSDADFIYHCSIPDTNLKPATFVLWNVGNPM